MQCSSCKFENMPGLALCGRCGANLQLAALVIDVHPPRASSRQRRLRRVTDGVAASLARANSMTDRLAKAVTSRCDVPEIPESQLLLRMVVPGWPQIYCGHVRRGKFFLYLYLALLFSGALLFGTGIGSVLLGLAVSCHVSSVLDVILLQQRSVWQRIAACVVASLGVALLVYLPAGYLLGRAATPVVFAQEATPLHTGDVLLVTQMFTPKIGDVVVYDIPTTSINGLTINNRAARIQIEGSRIDRIIAGPGQRVEFKNGHLTVDGKSSKVLPLNPRRYGHDFVRTVPPGSWLIVPSTDPVMDAQAMELNLIVRQDHVLGQVLMRSHPLTSVTRASRLAAE
jgi:hypothetical protein